MKKKFGQNVYIWIAILVGLFLALTFFNDQNRQPNHMELSYSEFLEKVENGQVKNATIEGAKITGTTMDGRYYKTYDARDPKLIDRLKTKEVNFKQKPPADKGSLWSFILHALPTLILIGFWIYALRQMGGGGGKAMSFGKSKAKLTSTNKKVTFDDVAGVQEAKEDLKEVVQFLKNPEKFQKLGGRIPRGVLLSGHPGTGKTLLARAVAGEAQVPFFSISGSDFVEMFVGVGASRVRDMFEQGRKNAPCIIFIDEIDAVGRHRGVGHGGGNDEREQTLNQLLVEMDGFEENDAVIIIAATNRPDVLDPALLRPGRFDREIHVDLPDLKGREEILKIHMQKVPVSQDVDIKTIARGTPGFSGAHLSNLVNEAALLSARYDRKYVTHHDFDQARDKILMGPERRSLIRTDLEIEKTAYHEAGHALLAYELREHAHPIYKATILPRGRALGMVQQLPENDRTSQTLIELKNNIIIYMGGRVAEEVIYGEDFITTGAVGDIKGATDIARHMVAEVGLTKELGLVHYDLKGSALEGAKLSEKTHELIDAKVKEIIDNAYTKAKNLMTHNINKLHTLAKSLLEHETLTGEQIAALMEGKPLHVNSDKEVREDKDKRDGPAIDPSPAPSPQA